MKELITQAKQNDEQAISQLMGMVAQKSKYIALGYVKNDGDKADDIVQETFIKAFSSLDSLENPERFEPWFYTILNRVAINHTRVKLIDKESTHFSELDYEETNFEESIYDDYIEFQPKENFDYSELKSGMQEVLEELPFAQKEAVYMYYFEGLNAREIANLFETTEDTIHSRLRYAKVKMKEKIEAMEVQGKSLRGIAPIPFLLWMLNNETKNTIPTKYTIAKAYKPNKIKIHKTKVISSATKATIAKIGVYAVIVCTVAFGSSQIIQNTNKEEISKTEIKKRALSKEERARLEEYYSDLKKGLKYAQDNQQPDNIYYLEDIDNDGFLEYSIRFYPTIESFSEIGPAAAISLQPFSDYLQEMKDKYMEEHGNVRGITTREDEDYLYQNNAPLTYKEFETKIIKEIEQTKQKLES